MKNFLNKLSLKTEIISIVFILICVLVIGMINAVIIINKVASKVNIEENFKNEMEMKLESKAKLVNAWVIECESLLKAYSRTPVLREFLKDQDNEILRRKVQEYTETFYADLDNWEGIYTAIEGTYCLVHNNKAINGKRFRQDEGAKALQDELNKGFYNAGIIVSPATGKLILSMYCPIYDTDNKTFLGYAGAGVFLSELEDRLHTMPSSNSTDETKYTMLNLSNNLFIYDDDINLIAKNIEEPEYVSIVEQISQDKTKLYGQLKCNTKDLMRAYKYMNIHDWAIIGSTYADIDNAAEASVQTLVSYMPIIIIFGLAITLLTIYLLLKVIKKKLTQKIEETTRILEEATGRVEKYTNEINNSGEEFSDDSQMQAKQVEEISNSIDKTTSMISQTSTGAGVTSELAEKLSLAVSDGDTKMEKMINTISDMKNSSDEIGKIIKVIDDIASQTNILALNAAVEAARAGDAGKGFAVVAEEVRNLAQKSAESAKNSSTIIEKNLELSETGVDVANEVFESLKTISEDVEKVKTIAKEAADATAQESKGMENVSGAIREIEKNTNGIAEKAQKNVEFSNSLRKEMTSVRKAVINLKQIIGSKRK